MLKNANSVGRGPREVPSDSFDAFCEFANLPAQRGMCSISRKKRNGRRFVVWWREPKLGFVICRNDNEKQKIWYKRLKRYRGMGKHFYLHGWLFRRLEAHLSHGPPEGTAACSLGGLVLMATFALPSSNICFLQS